MTRPATRRQARVIAASLLALAAAACGESRSTEPNDAAADAAESDRPAEGGTDSAADTADSPADTTNAGEDVSLSGPCVENMVCTGSGATGNPLFVRCVCLGGSWRCDAPLVGPVDDAGCEKEVQAGDAEQDTGVVDVPCIIRRNMCSRERHADQSGSLGTMRGRNLLAEARTPA